MAGTAAGATADALFSGAELLDGLIVSHLPRAVKAYFADWSPGLWHHVLGIFSSCGIFRR
jgi:hypothetical protein